MISDVFLEIGLFSEFFVLMKIEIVSRICSLCRKSVFDGRGVGC